MKKAVVAVIKQHNNILLLERYDDDRTNSGWCLPGGKVDKDETLENAIVRECREEIGLTPIIKEYKGHYISYLTGREPFEVHVFLVDIDGDIKLNLDEFQSYGWFSGTFPTLAGNTFDAIEIGLM